MDAGPSHQPQSRAGAAKPIGMACRACRLRKIRCGGELPRCGYCVKKGYECVLTPHKKRGRPRKDERRGQSGGSASSGAGGGGGGARSMTMPEDAAALDVRRLWRELTGLPGLDLPPELSALAAGSALQLQDPDPGAVPSVAPAFSLGLLPPVPPTAQAQPPALGDPLLFASNYAFPSSDDLAALAGVDRLLAAQPPAQARPRTGTASQASSTHQSFTGDGILGLRPAGDGAKQAPGRGAQDQAAAHQPADAIPAAVDDGIKAYFVYVHPWFPILHRPTFERQVRDGCVDPMLYYAVQAIAARFTPAAAGRRRPHRKGRRFARAARAQLPAALAGARLETLQAITLLALYMAVSGHWQEGAAYEKLAVQLAFIGQYHLLDEEFLLPPVTNNMGVYEAGWSERSQPARLEVLSRPGGILDHEQRRRVWWSIFQLERFNGLAMGRPPIIKPGWHWVWLPCSEDLWAQDNPSGPLAWEMGLADPVRQRPADAVSNSRVDLVLALIMGQLVEQRTELFRLFFPRVYRGTLLHDNLPTHALGWDDRLRRLRETIGALERRFRQWHAELGRYADRISARRHANFELMGASCQIHLYACVLQIREHLFEDLLITKEANDADCSAPATPDEDADLRSDCSRSSSVDLSALLDKAACQRSYMARASRPKLTTRLVRDLDALARRCWDRSVAMSDEAARLLRLHWLRPFDSSDATDKPLSVFDEQVAPAAAPHQPVGAPDSGWTLGDRPPPLASPTSAAGGDGASSRGRDSEAAADPLVADRFKLMSPQTPYHLFVAGKVQAARLKQAVTARSRGPREKAEEDAAKDPAEDSDADEDPVADAIRRIDDIWHAHGLDADPEAIEARLGDIIAALEYCQLFWYSLNFASHLKYLRAEARKPLLHSVYRE
ncbi:hypothetical protein H4R18_004309 [Coemansia javaensis]|uniref:Zn(2)-C6 fungal-type domain-containing protein n=1 Tax=Coemansia javaensis TaxID=2761396 RepID=A0A9W8H4L4_9FUNG|nr:hypothetical protein H4R18_004309 [Coemansia javaensis]